MGLLHNKTLTEIRAIAQSMGCKWDFSDDKDQLIQKISIKRDDVIPAVVPIEIPMPDDQRLRSRPPSKVSDKDILIGLLLPYFDRGLHITFTDDGQSWSMTCGVKSDSGTLRQTPVNVLRIAQKLMS